MSEQSRQRSALLAMSLGVVLGFVLLAPPAHPQSAIPAAQTTAADSWRPAQADSPDRDDPKIARRQQEPRTPPGSPGSGTPASVGSPAPTPTVTAGVAVPAVSVAAVNGIVWPVAGPITSVFGVRFHPVLHVVKLHTGMDLGASCGTPVAAALGGVVTYSGVDRAYGGRVVIDHGIINGHRLATTYSHLSALGVTVGHRVNAGSGIGLVGTTGFSTGCHLHVELVVDGSFFDPAPWFRNGSITVTSVGAVVPVTQVENPIPEPEVPNDATTPLLPVAPVVSGAPSASVTPSSSSAEASPVPSGNETVSPSTSPTSGTTTPPAPTPSATVTATETTTPSASPTPTTEVTPTVPSTSTPTPPPATTPPASSAPATSAPATSAPATTAPSSTRSATSAPPASSTPSITSAPAAPTTSAPAPSGGSSSG